MKHCPFVNNGVVLLHSILLLHSNFLIHNVDFQMCYKIFFVDFTKYNQLDTYVQFFCWLTFFAIASVAENRITSPALDLNGSELQHEYIYCC